ncbi:hypothetical protein [Seonamhaeicola aphaedonensis]|uniref:Cardiolipin synthetase n=1 Tax=Seonamhaeicola aphaedonensis TaxID=1461338 RepID=A0A3D9HIQ0_9FLAO|nr:hypothetical protein [Seonamhaeicola aphaedonensis]RED49360.1 hypothetical protein DFQ02_102132 [Seonamhaeicola aphaedonensis]
MRYLCLLFISSLVISCFSTELIENWKNPDIETYSPSKVLILGITPNIEARVQFEKQLRDELTIRDIEAVMSIDYLSPTFTSYKKTEEELKSLEDSLIYNGFDTIILSKVIGIEDKIDYREDFNDYENSYIKFKEDYLRYQDAYYNPDYYNEYTIYHTETSMYCICPSKNRELIWKGYIDITDPNSMNETINEYVRLVIIVLEEQQLIYSNILENKPDEDAIN